MRGETRTVWPAARRVAGGLALLGAATVGYGVYERDAYTLTRREVPILAPGAAPLRLLHLSDLHVTPGQTRKFDWLGELGRLVPDLVAMTGDVLSHQDSSAPLRRALAPLYAFPGVFIPGNNDYYVPKPRSPHHYFKRHPGGPHKGPALDWDGFAKDLVADSGWRDMTHVHDVLTIGGRRLDVRGVDDARSRRDRVALVAGPPEPGADVVLGLSHTPEPRVLDAFTADGVQLTLSGHTHGGQIRLPFVGALVTNCGLDPSRARGLSRWSAAGPDGAQRMSWLHVSAGLGTSPYAPIRLGCRPEATLLTLVPAR
ncbi:metallophosphoesterase [Pseudofrankia inefficax]|uniref:Metallophosphoesterase n=1 Tax=Pseudofrankia inefficax (strain DSM 45817 / CECT 9037 / DDB 130130 / EuI1c) TaxID=298654 RepID=E3J7G1_PSEI1|nr:metallophosphoesterase [Pseudofrankia inefficax]ADP78434.1 metallophosphoesterase [Pseudofrankia inefficax]